MLLRARGVDVNAYDKAAGKPVADTERTNSAKSKAASSKKDSKLIGTDANKGSRGKDGASIAEGEEDEEPPFWIEVSASA